LTGHVINVLFCFYFRFLQQQMKDCHLDISSILNI